MESLSRFPGIRSVIEVCDETYLPDNVKLDLVLEAITTELDRLSAENVARLASVIKSAASELSESGSWAQLLSLSSYILSLASKSLRDSSVNDKELLRIVAIKSMILNCAISGKELTAAFGSRLPE
jgi:hypothetical protein